MSDETVTQPVRLDDYDVIEAAVMETARGRWFLAEHARRQRAADTAVVLTALARIEAMVEAPRTAPELDRIRLDIREMARAIARTKAEIAAIKPEGGDIGRFEEASVELDAIVQATEAATSDILGAAETIQEIAWTLREMGTEGEVCDLIDTKATDIYTACSFQDVTGQRTRKVIGVLRFLEDRIDSMMNIWGEAHEAGDSPPAAVPRPREPSLQNGPARPGEGLAQDDVDLMMNDALFDAPKLPPPAPAAAIEIPVTARATAAAALSTDERPMAPMPPPARMAGSPPPDLPSIEDIEKLSFVEKVALMS
ncbi:hypothetical protein [Phreatobacter sp. AB_2022a]|uniref:hypothetical protein n=1 Tax=Phreatobacter sp. AB_2022a TaxID=3003134 RepID=UPI0022876690|nr:hypothetical protein [Phreatobacter sp. AB_2022a]MCZ0735505.1 hypothetical protein [Phreatobacter sp. AB_2022a]